MPCVSPDFAERSPVPPMVPRVDAPILVHCFGRIEGRKRPLANRDKTYELQTGLLIVEKFSIGMGRTWRKWVARISQRCLNCVGRSSLRPRSRGGVKVPTGGNGERSPKPASARRAIGGVSRFGAIPKPTVTVRMEENGTIWRTHGVSSFEARTP